VELKDVFANGEAVLAGVLCPTLNCSLFNTASHLMPVLYIIAAVLTQIARVPHAAANSTFLVYKYCTSIS